MENKQEQERELLSAAFLNSYFRSFLRVARQSKTLLDELRLLLNLSYSSKFQIYATKVM